MPVDPKTLVPVERDPKKLRRTAFVLVGIMILGGIFVLAGYRYFTEKNRDDRRPARISRIQSGFELPVMLQDGSQIKVPDDGGKVWVVALVNTEGAPLSARSLEVMKRVKAKYAANEDVRLLSLVVDAGPAADLPEQLKKEAEKEGAVLPQWWVASNQQETLHKFTKNQFKTSLYPNQKNGVWSYDTSIILIDRDRHIRKAVIPQQRGGDPFIAPFDFDAAAEWDAKGVKTGTDLNNQQQLEKVLEDTIERLLAEPVKQS